jgi:hypothetical protein
MRSRRASAILIFGIFAGGKVVHDYAAVELLRGPSVDVFGEFRRLRRRVAVVACPTLGDARSYQ